jgi:hypothetical protein
VSERFVPTLPPLFDRFRERRTMGQRKRAVLRRADIVRQRVLVMAARLAKPVTRWVRKGG